MKILNKTQSLSFVSAKDINASELVTFSKEYLNMVKIMLEYFKNNTSTSLLFTRLQENGNFKVPIIYQGFVEEIKDNYFTFLNNYNISSFTETDDLIKNVIRVDNVLGIIPILPKFEGIKILERNHTNQAFKYFRFLVKIKNELKNLILYTTNHYVDLIYKNKVIECEILEINNSNLLISQKRMYNPELENGMYKFVDLIPQVKNILFIERDDFLRGVILHPNEILEINPYDED